MTVEAPAFDGAQLVDATTWGELGFQLFLRAHGIDTQVAKLAAAGWAGDRVTTIEKDGHVIGLARFAWDTEADAIEAFDAAERAIDDSQLAAGAPMGAQRRSPVNSEEGVMRAGVRAVHPDQNPDRPCPVSLLRCL